MPVANQLYVRCILLFLTHSFSSRSQIKGKKGYEKGKEEAKSKMETKQNTFQKAALLGGRTSITQ